MLRSVDKDPTKALPDFFQKTVVANWMRDQTSVIHPYGAFIVPVLANAAGVYHTNPKLVYIPDDTAFGEFQENFANTLALFEERPEGKQLHVNSFGNPEEVVSSRKAFHKTYNNTCDIMDREQYLRSRLFDMWIGDWSRREDQWRWGKTEGENSNTVYQPIPRDRDHAFFKFKDGFITRIISWFRPSYQTFSKKYGNVSGLNKSARPMDDVLLAYLNKNDFERIAQDMKMRLSDDVIQQALHQWPDTIYELTGKDFFEKLKARREKLPSLADEYYQILAKEVLYVGTDDEEVFKIEPLNKEEVRVQIIRISGKCNGSEIIADRIFKRSETKVISLYGLGDEDEFEILGKSGSPITINIYPGEGEDRVYGEENANLNNISIYTPGDGDSLKHTQGAKVEEYKPLAEDYTAEGWLLRHRLE
ncbi:MAG: hypothetical protein LPK19_02175 [Hymenobacteraceae bacterium]|nr:hypothetical protein [Hymenobacteraceae bacterium]MDX5394984.1 hypothetical protein [Hymenobacteraceae bacterium]MDX5511017.1 hypothetical protein [Hymenobacteraceae bacterium]